MIFLHDPHLFDNIGKWKFRAAWIIGFVNTCLTFRLWVWYFPWYLTSFQEISIDTFYDAEYQDTKHWKTKKNWIIPFEKEISLFTQVFVLVTAKSFKCKVDLTEKDFPGALKISCCQLSNKYPAQNRDLSPGRGGFVSSAAKKSCCQDPVTSSHPRADHLKSSRKSLSFIMLFMCKWPFCRTRICF